jgi:hypothetical protein
MNLLAMSSLLVKCWHIRVVVSMMGRLSFGFLIKERSVLNVACIDIDALRHGGRVSVVELKGLQFFAETLQLLRVVVLLTLQVLYLVLLRY